MPRYKYESLADIPDIVPAELLIPSEREDLRVPQLDDETSNSTTPLEVGYVLFDNPGWLHMYTNVLEINLELGERTEDFLTRSWMNHTGRAVVRAALDPDRYAPIDMLAVYKHECTNYDARFPSRDEESYYKNWVENFGLFER